MRPKTGDRKCYRCKEIKPLSAFYSSTQSYCKFCYREWKNKNYAQNPIPYRDYMKKRSRLAREAVLSHYSMVASSPACACCGELEKKFLSIDHINNDGAKQRKEARVPSGSGFYTWLVHQKFPLGFQVLCFNCNHGKYLNGNKCPHQDEFKNLVERTLIKHHE